MKNKSFENYYDHVHVDEHLLDQKKSYKHHSFLLSSFICLCFTKQTNK